MYAFSVELGVPFSGFEEAVAKVKEALLAEKMGVVSEINVQAIFKAKMNLETPGYLILGACVPPLAKRVIDADPDGGALLPCNVIVREEQGGKIFVVFMDPKPILGLAQNAELDRVATEATEMLNRVKARLAG